MGKKDNRRSFIQKIAALSSGALLISKTGFSFQKRSEDAPDIKNIKPLGFRWETQDPFLFCVHHEDFYPNGNEYMGPDASLEGRDIGQDFMIKDGWRMYHGSKVPGFPGHPHRGFETITVVRTGMVDHSDSLGGSGRYGDGDVQWMTAGKGVQHAEMFPLINKNSENPLELFQIWINLSAKNKFVEPHYKMFWNEDIPHISQKDKNGKEIYIEVLVGELGMYSSPKPPPGSWASTKENEVAIWNIKMEANAEWILPKASLGVNRTIYFYAGENMKVGDDSLDHYHSADVRADSEILLRNGSSDANILILQGKPIGEPVVQHGPFVMNSKQEIKQAFDDYQRTKFGGWPWPVNDPVHSREKGRFAYHANGKKEIKG